MLRIGQTKVDRMPRDRAPVAGGWKVDSFHGRFVQCSTYAAILRICNTALLPSISRRIITMERIKRTCECLVPWKCPPSWPRQRPKRPVSCEPPRVPSDLFLESLETTPRACRIRTLLGYSKKALVRIYAAAFETPRHTLPIGRLRRIERIAMRFSRDELVKRIIAREPCELVE